MPRDRCLKINHHACGIQEYDCARGFHACTAKERLRKTGETQAAPMRVLRTPLAGHRLEASSRRDQEAHGLVESQTTQSMLENIESSAGSCLALTRFFLSQRHSVTA